MKKILMAVVALAVMGFVGCQKDDNAIDNKLKVNFTVADKASFDNGSRAVKADWAVGDEILIIFKGSVDASSTAWIAPYDNANTVKLTKTAEGWSADVSKLPANLAGFVDGGSYVAFHYPGNIHIGSDNFHIFEFPIFDTYAGGEFMSANGIYTISGNELNIGTITLARPADGFQISVKGLTPEVGEKWYLEIYSEFVDGTLQHTGLSQGGNEMLSCRIDEETAYAGIFGSWESLGVKNGEDVSFFFTSIDDGYEGTTLYYSLYSNTAKNYWYKTTSTAPGALEGKAWSLPAVTEWKTEKTDLE